MLGHTIRLAALEVDHEMRRDVRRNGKRPRDAFNEMISGVAKRFKTSDVQVKFVDSQLFS